MKYEAKTDGRRVLCSSSGKEDEVYGKECAEDGGEVC